MKLKDPHPFINGVGLSSPHTHLLHILPWPTELGAHGPSLCGTTSAPIQGGWVEPVPDTVWPENIYCSACINRFRLMIVDEDPRLNSEDRRRWERIKAETTQSQSATQ